MLVKSVYQRRGLTTYLLYGLSLSISTIGFWLLIILKISVSDSIFLIKSAIYLPFTAKVSPEMSSALPSMIAGISVVPAPLSVFPEEMITLFASVLIWMKLLISLVRIQIFFMALSVSFLSSISVNSNFVGTTSSLS